MGAVFFAATLSVDALGVGMSCGLRGQRPGIAAYGVLFVVSFLVMGLAVGFGEVLTQVLPGELAGVLAGAWVMALGAWIVIGAFKKNKEQANPPGNSITLRGAASLALILSIDSMGAGVAAAALGISTWLLPILVAAFQIAFLFIGISAVRLFKLKKEGSRAWSVASGVILIIIGIIRLV